MGDEGCPGGRQAHIDSIRKDLMGPLGPLDFESAQHRRTPRPSVDGTHSKTLCPFRSQQGSRESVLQRGWFAARIGLTARMVRGERLKGGPQVGHVRCPQVGTHSHAHQDPKSAFTRPIVVPNGEAFLGPLGSSRPNIGGHRNWFCRKAMLPFGSHQAPLYRGSRQKSARAVSGRACRGREQKAFT